MGSGCKGGPNKGSPIATPGNRGNVRSGSKGGGSKGGQSVRFVVVDVEDVSPMSVEEKAKILLATKQAAQQSVGGNMPSFGRIGEAGK